MYLPFRFVLNEIFTPGWPMGLCLVQGLEERGAGEDREGVQKQRTE